MPFQTYHFDKPFALEQGGELASLDIAFHTYGRLSPARDNIIWVCHALTADSDVAGWWPHTVVSGGFLDPDRYFIVCANIIGSCYGTTGPLSADPLTGRPYYGSFPKVSMRDQARAHAMLADRLGLTRIHGLVGASVGGFQAIEWASAEPQRFSRLALIATAPKASPWTIAIDETQRMALLADTTFGEPRPDAGAAGLAAARALGLLTYRGPEGYNLTQNNHSDAPPTPCGLPAVHRACTYQRHQGKKLVDRFNAYSYMSILNTFDTHDIGRNRGGVEKALDSIGHTVGRVSVTGVSTDLVFTAPEMQALADAIPGAVFHSIDSQLGHDGFLVEHRQLNAILKPFFQS